MNKIKETRQKFGMTQRALGVLLGVSQTTISAWEIGRNEPDIGNVFAMADYFDTTPKELMGYVDQCTHCEFRAVRDTEYDFSCSVCACNRCLHIHSCNGQCGERGNAR